MNKIIFGGIAAYLLYRLFRSDLRQQITKTAQSYIGVPYNWGGCTPSGFDCSGFVQYVFKQNGINLPRTTGELWATLPTKLQASPGDLLALDPTGTNQATHVGIYLGNGQFIHAATSSGVSIDDLTGFWNGKILAIHDPF